MEVFMKLMRLAVFTLIVSTGFNSLAWRLIVPFTGDHCKDQLVNSLDYLFGDYEILSWTKDSSHKTRGNGGEIWHWIETDLCDGKFVGVVSNFNSKNCKHAHYISVPRYVRRVFATSECRQMLKGNFKPSKKVARGQFD